MTTYTKRPNSDQAVTGTNLNKIGSAGTYASILSDTSDGTYLQLFGYPDGNDVIVGVPPVAPASNETIMQYRVVVRARAYGAGIAAMTMRARDINGNLTPVDYVALNNNTFTTYYGTWRSTAPNGSTVDPAELFAIHLNPVPMTTGSPEVADAWLEIQTNFAPTAAGAGPNATTTITQFPAFTWTYADADLDPQTAFRVKVFSAAQYSAGGFDPNTTTPTEDSGEVISGLHTWTPSNPLPNATYRAFIWVRDATGRWSSVTTGGPYAYVTVAAVLPAIPTVLPTVDHANARHSLLLQDYQNLLSDDGSSFEASAGGWAAITNCTVARVLASAEGALTPVDGLYVLRVTTTGAGTSQAQSALTPVVAGATYTAAAHLRAGNVTAHLQRVDIKFYDAASALISTVAGDQFTPPFATFQRGWATAAAPAGAAYASVVVTFLSDVAGETHYVDAASITAGNRNLLESPLFDTDTNSDGLVDNWGTYDFAGPSAATYTMATLAPYMWFGTKTQQISWSANSGWKGIWQGGRALVSGRQYTASAWVRMDNAGPVQLYVSDAANPTSTVTVPADTWTRIFFTFTASATATGLGFYIRSTSPANTMWVAHAQLEIGNVLSHEIVGWTRGGMLSSARFQVQRSDDGGASWVDLDRLLVAGLGVSNLSGIDYSDALQSLVAYDYESHGGVAPLYRARVASGTLISAWSVPVSADALVPAWRLTDIDNPDTRSVALDFHSTDLAWASERRQGVLYPLGRTNAVVMSDEVSGKTGQLDFAMLDGASIDAFDELWAEGPIMFLRSRYGDNRYVSFTGRGTQSQFVNPAGVRKGVYSVGVMEVDAP